MGDKARDLSIRKVRDLGRALYFSGIAGESLGLAGVPHRMQSGWRGVEGSTVSSWRKEPQYCLWTMAVGWVENWAISGLRPALG